MGSSSSQIIRVTPAESEESLAPICDPCVNQHLSARGWCGQCGVYLCDKCVSTHNRSHRLSMGRQMPQSRPNPGSIENNVSVKVLTPLATLEDKDMQNDEVPSEERRIRGCVSIDKYIVTIKLKNLTLYDEEFQCIGDIDYKVFNPNSICSRANAIVVSFERLKEVEPQQLKKMPPFKDIQTYELKPPSCTSDAKLVKRKNFNTEGQCFTTAICPLYDKELTTAVGMKLDSHPERDDIEYQVQIIKSNGHVLQTLYMDPRAEPSFDSEFFLCATMKFSEIVVSEAKQKQIRGLNLKTGKTMFQFEGGSPQGITCDSEDNIYVYNDSQMFWIPPLRNKIHYMQQGYHKKAKNKETRMAVSVCFNDTSKTLYKTHIDKDTIEAFTIT